MQPLTKAGDIVRVPLADGRFAYLRHISQRDNYGALMEVKSLFDDGRASVKEIIASPHLFSPIFVAINPPVRAKRWVRVGFASAEGVEFPRFRVTTDISRLAAPGVRDDWAIWDGERSTFVGVLPIELRSLEFLCTWPYLRVEERIASGENFYERLT